MHFNQLVALATLLATAAHGIALPDPDAAADVTDIAEEAFEANPADVLIDAASRHDPGCYLTCE